MKKLMKDMFYTIKNVHMALTIGVEITVHVACHRLVKTISPMLFLLIGISLFYPSGVILWGTSAFGLYHLLGLIYLLLEGCHQTVLSYRTTAYDNLIGDPWMFKRLVPHTLVYTDKRFN